MPGMSFRPSSDTISEAVRLAAGHWHRTNSPPQTTRRDACTQQMWLRPTALGGYWLTGLSGTDIVAC